MQSAIANQNVQLQALASIINPINQTSIPGIVPQQFSAYGPGFSSALPVFAEEPKEYKELFIGKENRN